MQYPTVDMKIEMTDFDVISLSIYGATIPHVIRQTVSMPVVSVCPWIAYSLVETAQIF